MLNYPVLKRRLISCDFYEAITYSFVDPKIQSLLHPEVKPLVLPNPISVEMSAMRVSLLTGLLGAVIYNQNRQQNRVRLFEFGLRLYRMKKTEFGVRQEPVFAAVMTGSKANEQWSEKTAPADFYDLKGYIENLLSLSSAGNRAKFIAKSYTALHPGQSAAIMLMVKKLVLSDNFTQLLHKKIGLIGKAFVCEISVEHISRRDVSRAKEISRFPANRRDLAVVVADNVPANDVLGACRAAGGDKVTQVNLFDVYQGNGVATGH